MNTLIGAKMNRKSRRAARSYMRRDEQGHGGGGGTGDQNQGGAPNNQGGNSGDSNGNSGGGADNGGQGFDLNQFWSDPQPQNGGQSPNQQQPSGDSQGNQGGDQGSPLGRQLVEQLTGFNAGNLFDDAVAQQINDGDLSGINGRFNELGQNLLRQSIMMNTHVVRAFGEQMVERMQSMIQEHLGGRDNEAAMLEAFPSAKDTRVRPVIERVFNQSLKINGGDRTKAIEMTREMLKLVGQNASTDLGFETPPSGRDDDLATNAASLVEDLLGRR